MWKPKPKVAHHANQPNLPTTQQINHALEANVDFPYHTNNNKTPVVTTKDLEDIQVYQSYGSFWRSKSTARLYKNRILRKL